MKRTDLRNIAIIAHVDHGKTTLVDGLLRQSNTFRSNQQVAERVMDSNDLERERGITILAKNTAITIQDPETNQPVKINVVDTPGHADFGGEVERVLNMVDGVLLLVDAAEGPMPQTRFVLKKALELGHRAIVVINKVDRRDADPERVLNETFDLFIDLGATDEQAEFPVVYSVATTGKAGLTPELGSDLQPLFETILRELPPPDVDPEDSFRMLVTTLDYDNYRGQIVIGRIFAGELNTGDMVARLKPDQPEPENGYPKEPVRYLYVQEGLNRVEVDTASAGEIIAIAGLETMEIGDTLANPDNPIALPAITVEEPTVRMHFGVNTGPLAGREGRWGTSRRLRERLYEELKQNIALRVDDTDDASVFIVSGRGELHLAILIETMRREGYEFQVSPPEVIFRKDENGKNLEPFEEVYIETSSETVGATVEMLSKRKGIMQHMENTSSGAVNLIFIVPTRGLLGFRHQFLKATRGLGIINAIFHGYKPVAGTIQKRARGSIVAWEKGDATVFGLRNAEQRGVLFVAPGTAVYEGMVIGEQPRAGDLDINVCKTKQLSAIHTVSFKTEERLSPPKDMSLDECIEYLSEDELLEVTPESLRIRKRTLDKRLRAREIKQAKESVKV
ncbi:MAG: translational GTPase TypA [Chloroflexota bacterium]